MSGWDRFACLTLGFALLTLSACGGSGSGSRSRDDDSGTTPTPAPLSTAEMIAQLETSGKLPRLDRSADIRGPDTNNNGIRDDIDTFIAAQAYTDPQKTSLQQLARATQSALLTPTTDRSAMDAVRLAQARAVSCAFARFPVTTDRAPATQVAETIEKITANTKPRVLAYLQFAKSSDGVVLPSPSGDTCE